MKEEEGKEVEGKVEREEEGEEEKVEGEKRILIRRFVYISVGRMAVKPCPKRQG